MPERRVSNGAIRATGPGQMVGYNGQGFKTTRISDALHAETVDDRIEQIVAKVREHLLALGFSQPASRGDDELRLVKKHGKWRTTIRYRANCVHAEALVHLTIVHHEIGAPQTGRGQGWGDGGTDRVLRITGRTAVTTETHQIQDAIDNIVRRALADDDA